MCVCLSGIRAGPVFSYSFVFVVSLRHHFREVIPAQNLYTCCRDTLLCTRMYKCIASHKNAMRRTDGKALNILSAPVVEKFSADRLSAR